MTDLTASACEARNAATPDAPGVFYQSVMSYCRKAQHGKFPLNMTYPIVKHFDGLNDGLVAVDSAKWGDQFTLLEPRGHRGISHGDVVDLNRENIPGFDVREFYVSLVADLKKAERHRDAPLSCSVVSFMVGATGSTRGSAAPPSSVVSSAGEQ